MRWRKIKIENPPAQAATTRRGISNIQQPNHIVLSPLQSRILELLKEGPLTVYKAIDEIGITALSPRIRELRELGFDIKTQRLNVRNRYGEVRCIGEYVLIEKELCNE